eukprot:7968674-Pyramimonas_sp.AAC.1
MCGLSLKCQMCARRFSLKGRVQDFRPGACPGPAHLSSDPLTHPLYPGRAANHRLRVLRSVLHCAHCGAHASVNVQSLARP